MMWCKILTERIATHSEFFVDRSKEIQTQRCYALLKFPECVAIEVDRTMTTRLIIIVLLNNLKVGLVVPL